MKMMSKWLLPEIRVGDAIEDWDGEELVIIGLAMASCGYIRVSDVCGNASDLNFEWIRYIFRDGAPIYRASRYSNG